MNSDIKLNAEQRSQFYIDSIDFLKKRSGCRDKFAMCGCLREQLRLIGLLKGNIPDISLIEIFPEFELFKPEEKNFGVHWFNSDSNQNQNTRALILIFCSEMAKDNLK